MHLLRPHRPRRQRVFMAAIVILSLALATLSELTRDTEASVPGTATNTLSQRRWFDTCSAPTQGQMQEMWNGSPYWAVGIYIGGGAIGCSQPQLTANWVSAVHEIGF